MTALQDYSLAPEDNGDDALDIDDLTHDQILLLHAKLEAKIKGLDLTEVNLVRETLLQIQQAKALQIAASGNNTPMNQRAQVQNSLAQLLVQLAKIQTTLYSSERIKRIQSSVIKVVKTLPKPEQDRFFELLEVELEEAAQETDLPEAGDEVR